MRLQHLKSTTDEQQRLHTLYDYRILDTESEPAYEDIARLAAMICEAPAAAITLIDKDRPWLKAKWGLVLEDPSLQYSFCAEVVANKKILVVQNAAENPLIKFYAGVPLITPEGFVLGALWVIDTKIRDLKPEQVSALETLSRQVMSQMELRKANFKFKEAYEKIDQQHLKLVHSAKLASIGEMAASIAHEINNPLTIINGNVGLLRRMVGTILPATEKWRLYLDGIENTVHRIDKIIRGLKALSRDGSADPFEVVDLRKSIDNAVSLVREKFASRGIDFNEVYPAPPMWIECRAVQIEQIIINLLNNTYDAVRDLPQKWVEVRIQDSGSYWTISIADSGPGIPKSHQDKIMLPFFTTKELHQGTGLGLSISKGIAEEHNGSLELDRQSPNTKFVITLPKKQKPQKNGA